MRSIRALKDGAVPVGRSASRASSYSSFSLGEAQREWSNQQAAVCVGRIPLSARRQLDVFPLNHRPFRSGRRPVSRRDGEINLACLWDCASLLLYFFEIQVWHGAFPPLPLDHLLAFVLTLIEFFFFLKRPNIHSNSGPLLSVFQNNIFFCSAGP